MSLWVGKGHISVAWIAFGVGRRVAREACVVDDGTGGAHVPESVALSADMSGADFVSAGTVVDPLATTVEGDGAGDLGGGVVGDIGNYFLVGDVGLKPVAVDLHEGVHVLAAGASA